MGKNMSKEHGPEFNILFGYTQHLSLYTVHYSTVYCTVPEQVYP